MDEVVCRCVSCTSALATYSNLWTQIGKGYYSPILNGEGELQFTAQGSKREGEEGTLVAECILQDLACNSCKANIGLKCISSPVNHVLENDQILLRQAAIRVVSPRGRNPKDVELKVKRVLKLKDGPKVKSTPVTPAPRVTPPSGTQPRDGSHSYGTYSASSTTPGIFERMQAELDLQRGDIDRIDTAAFSVVSSFNTAVTRIDMEMEKLNDTMKSMRRDLEGYQGEIAPLKSGLENLKSSSHDQGSVKRLEERINSASDAVAAVRKLTQDAQARENKLQGELQATKKDLRLLQQETASLRQEVTAAKKAARDSAAASSSAARDIALLQTEMRQMRDSFKQEQERTKRSNPTSSAYSAEEVQILSSSIAKLADRTNHFEALQMQFDLFKPRMQRLEGRVSAVEDSREMSQERTRTKASHVPSGLYEEANPRKRHAAGSDTGPAMETPKKRQTVIKDTVHVATSPVARPSAHKQARKETFSSGSSTARLTKTGAVDKRTMKRARKPSWKEADSIYTPPDD